LHLTTDLLIALVPDLPLKYPHMKVRIDVEARDAPKVSFSAATGLTVNAFYRTTLFVDEESQGTPKIATLDCNLSVTGTVGWDTTVITSAVAKHTVVDHALNVPAEKWDATVAWFVQSYAGLYPMEFLYRRFVQSPVTALAALVNAVGGTPVDGWFVLSGDVQLLQM